jgi:predicted permease
MFGRRSRLDEEVAAHLAEEIAENIASGMAPDAARQAALRKFGNVEAAKELVRERDPLYWLDTLGQDIRFAFRLMGRNWALTATIVATLTVGIALNVTGFTLLNGFLMRPWVRADPETVVNVFHRHSGDYNLRYSDGGISQPDFIRYRDSARSLAGLAAYHPLNLTLGGAEAGTVRTALVSCNFAEVIKPAAPLFGRYLSPDECAPATPSYVAVLSEAAWRTRFAADGSVIGRTIHVNRRPFTVVGVAPSQALAGFAGDNELWIPYNLLGQVRPESDFFADQRAQWLVLVGRRRAEVPLVQVEQELRLLARRADEELPGRTTSVTVTDGSLIDNPDFRQRAPVVMAVTLGTTTLLLLLACVNVATLLLSRSAARQREVAVRLSLGAGRFRLLRQLLTEGLVLSGIAAVLSVLIVQQVPGVLWTSIMSSPAPFVLQPDWRVLLYCVGVAMATGVIAGLSPSLETLRPQLAESLKGSTGAVTTGKRRSRLRGVLVAVQVALSLLLVVQVVLFARSQRRYFSYDPGFETRLVINVTFASVNSGFSPPASFYRDVESRLVTVPGIVSASFSSIAPWSGRNITAVREVDGTPVPPAEDPIQDAARRVVTPDYFQTLQIPLTRGRAFTREEAASKSQVIPVVISEAMARRYWPGQDPLGHQFRLGSRRSTTRSPEALEVVGVSRDLQSVRPMSDDGLFYYRPLNMEQSKPPALLVRVSGDTQAAATALREIVRQADPQMATTVVTLASVIERRGEQMKPMMIYGAVAGALALLLALSGVYAVVSFAVSQRVREIGIRTALGAQRRDVIALVLRSGSAPIVGGLAVGLGLAVAASAVMRSVLVGVNPRDPGTLAVVALLLLAAALCAVLIPARRAAALDPLSSLRRD